MRADAWPMLPPLLPFSFKKELKKKKIAPEDYAELGARRGSSTLAWGM